MVDCLSRFSRLSRPTAPSAPSVTIGAVPPAKRHGAGLEPGPDTTSTSSASAIVDRAPDNFHLMALSLSYALVMRKASAVPVGPGAMLIAWDEIATLRGMP